MIRRILTNIEHLYILQNIKLIILKIIIPNFLKIKLIFHVKNVCKMYKIINEYSFLISTSDTFNTILGFPSVVTIIGCSKQLYYFILIFLEKNWWNKYFCGLESVKTLGNNSDLFWEWVFYYILGFFTLNILLCLFLMVAYSVQRFLLLSAVKYMLLQVFRLKWTRRNPVFYFWSTHTSHPFFWFFEIRGSFCLLRLS